MHPDTVATVVSRRRLLAAVAGCFIAERDRWLLWFPVFMGLGIAVYFSLAHEPAWWIGPVALIATGAAALIRWRLQGDLTLGGAIFALALGFAAAQFQTGMVAAPVVMGRLGPVEVTGRVVSVDPLPEGARLVIAPNHVGNLDTAHLPARLRVRLRRGEIGTVPGDWVAVRAMLVPPPAPSMPGAYDFQRRAWFDRLGAVGYALGTPKEIAPPTGEKPSFWRHAVEALRITVTRRIRAVLPDRSGAIAAAIIAGETHAIPPEDAGAFRDAGLAHILVIAGLHMGMAAGVAFFALRSLFALIPSLALRYPTKKWAASGALFVIFAYLLLSGATVSSRRAFVMVGLVLLAVIVDRISVSPRAVALAAVTVMLMTPEAATGPSFQMSFSAVGCLIAFYEAMRPRLSVWHRDAGATRRAALYFLGLAFTTIVTTFATAPFTIYHFNRFPLYSVVANALAVPITGFWVMPWGILSCLLMPLGLERLALIPMSKGIDAIAAIGHWVTSWPGAVMHVPSLPSAGLALVALGGLWLCIWLGKWRWFGLAPIALGLGSLLLVRPPDVLVSADMRLIAALAPNGTYLPSATRGLSAADTWTQRAATEFGPAWPENGSGGDGVLQCDAEGCFYRRLGHTVAFIRDGSALEDDCRVADLVVSPVAAHRSCRNTKIIDRVDAYEKGGHAIWLNSAGINIETVRDWQGDRPWSPHHDRRPAKNITKAGR